MQIEVEILAIRPAVAKYMEDAIEVYVAWATPNRAEALVGDEGFDWLYILGSGTPSLPRWNFELIRRIVNELVPRLEER